MGARGEKRARGGDNRAGGDKKGPRSVSPARRVAFEILRRVEDEGAFAAPLLASAADSLRPDDRALCYELALGCLRRKLWLDKAIEHYAGRAIETLDAPVTRALRLGLYQLRFLTRIPARAAVNESVNLAYEARLRSAASFINAVLRRAARETDYDPSEGLSDAVERISVETSHPLWLVERWVKSFGEAEAARFAHANNSPAPVSFRLNPLREESATLMARLRESGVEVERSNIAPDGWRIKGTGDAAALLRAWSSEGLIYLQDEASQLVAHVLGARAGERVLDVCAAPGSKTTHIAALCEDRASIVACDLYERRLRIVEELSARQGLKSVSTVALNAEEPLPFKDETFERVLVDAPCTGTGTLRHNPEIRWRIRPEDIEELSARQLSILRNAARVLKRGGRLVYSTCSVEPEENETTVSGFLASAGEFKKVTVENAPAELLTATGAARTWPHRDDADGFFVAAFEREG